MKIWVDDVRPAPEGYRWVRSVREGKIVLVQLLRQSSKSFPGVEILDLDHDAGEYMYDGGDYINLLSWLEWKSREKGWNINFPIRIHTQNVVGRENMKRIIKKNGWKEVF